MEAATALKRGFVDARKQWVRRKDASRCASKRTRVIHPASFACTRRNSVLVDGPEREEELERDGQETQVARDRTSTDAWDRASANATRWKRNRQGKAESKGKPTTETRLHVKEQVQRKTKGDGGRRSRCHEQLDRATMPRPSTPDCLWSERVLPKRRRIDAKRIQQTSPLASDQIPQMGRPSQSL